MSIVSCIYFKCSAIRKLVILVQSIMVLLEVIKVGLFLISFWYAVKYIISKYDREPEPNAQAREASSMRMDLLCGLGASLCFVFVHLYRRYFHSNE